MWKMRSECHGSHGLVDQSKQSSKKDGKAGRLKCHACESRKTSTATDQDCPTHHHIEGENDMPEDAIGSLTNSARAHDGAPAQGSRAQGET